MYITESHTLPIFEVICNAFFFFFFEFFVCMPLDIEAFADTVANMKSNVIGGIFRRYFDGMRSNSPLSDHLAVRHGVVSSCFGFLCVLVTSCGQRGVLFRAAYESQNVECYIAP